MLKVFHSTYLHESTNSIQAQLEQEARVAKISGLSWDTFIWIAPKIKKDKSFIVRWISYINRIKYYLHIISISKSYDILLLRYIPADPMFSLITIILSNRIITVHHTKELEEIKTIISTESRIKYFIDYLSGIATLYFVKAIIAVTPEIAEYELLRVSSRKKNYFIFPNAAVDIGIADDKRSSTPTFLFAATYLDSPWHGLDILIEMLQTTDKDLKVHIISSCSISTQEKMYGIKSIIYHGIKTQEEIKSIAAECHVGLGSLMQHRRNLKQACTLKVREYLSLGLPVYVTYEEVLLHDFMFCRRGQIQLEAFLQFAEDTKTISRDTIREMALKLISKEVILQKLYSELNLTFK